MSTIPVICHADGRRFTVEASRLTPALRCACGSADIDLDETLGATASETKDCPKCKGRGYVQVSKGKGPDGRPSQVGEKNCDRCGGSGSVQKTSASTPPPWVGARQASFETDPEMGQVKETDSVKQKVTCSSCFTEATITATDPAQPLPPCPNCGSPTLSPGGSTLARRRQATYANPTQNCLKIMELQSQAYDALGINGFGGPDDPKRREVIEWIKQRIKGLNITQEDLDSLEDNNAHAGAEAAEQVMKGKTALRRQAKITEVAQGIQATNPGMPTSVARRVATQTVARYPKMIGN